MVLQPLRGNFFKDDQHIYFRDRCLTQADVKNFVVVADSLGHDGRTVFYGGHVIKGADVKSLRLLERCPWGGPLTGTPEQTVKDSEDAVLEEFSQGFYRDDKHVYFRWSVLDGIDPGTFRVHLWPKFLDTTSYISDSNGFYSLKPLWNEKGGKPVKFKSALSDFRYFENDLIADADNAYFRGRKVKAIDAGSIEIFPGAYFYFKDKSAVYWYAPGHPDGLDVVKKALPNEFIAPMGHKAFGTDHRQLYSDGLASPRWQTRWTPLFQKWRAKQLTDAEFDKLCGLHGLESQALKDFLKKHADRKEAWWNA